MSYRLRVVVIVLSLLGSFHLASIFFGSHFWWLDIWSHFQLQIGLVGIVLVPLVWLMTRSKVVAGGVALYTVGIFAWVFLVVTFASIPPSSTTLDVYYQNVHFGSTKEQHVELAGSIVAIPAKIYAFVEPHPTFVSEIERLLGVPPVLSYLPNSTSCAVFVTDPNLVVEDATVVLSRDHDPLCLVRFSTFDLFVAHPLPPLSRISFERQDSFFRALSGLINESEQNGRTWLTVGDFNATPFSSRLRGAYGRYLENHFYTWSAPGILMIPIDQSFGNTPLQHYLYPAGSSDHRGLGVIFAAPP